LTRRLAFSRVSTNQLFAAYLRFMAPTKRHEDGPLGAFCATFMSLVEWHPGMKLVEPLELEQVVSQGFSPNPHPPIHPATHT
jgi:hypothetical protein